MKTLLRIAAVILCVIALYYLVVVLARSVAEEPVGLAPPRGAGPAQTATTRGPDSKPPGRPAYPAQAAWIAVSSALA